MESHQPLVTCIHHGCVSLRLTFATIVHGTQLMIITCRRGQTLFHKDNHPLHCVTSTVKGRTCSFGTPIMSFEGEHLQSTSRHTRSSSHYPRKRCQTIRLRHTPGPASRSHLAQYIGRTHIYKSMARPQQSHSSCRVKRSQSLLSIKARPTSWPRHWQTRGHLS